jgi:hypothetical protein
MKATTMIINCVISTILIISLCSTKSSGETMLFDFNSGSGKDLPGWTWTDDVSYGKAGFVRDIHSDTLRGKMPRILFKTDYGNKNDLEISLSEKAPSTSTGGSLKIFEKPENTVHQCGIWMWSGSATLRNEGVVDENTQQLDFYMKTTGMSTFEDNDTNGSSEGVPNGNIHIGTYLCWGSGQATGDGCPYEGPGNQHYYHYLSINPGAWIHVKLDQHPTIRRNQGKSRYNPAFYDDGIHHYWQYLSEMYIEIRSAQTGPTEMFLDELKFLSNDDLTETDVNNSSITSLHVGYWANNDYWEIGWNDCSFNDEDLGMNDYTQSTFEIRWSISPITNENFNQANKITPLKYGGESYCGPGGKNLINRPNAWARVAWTRFTLPDDVEQTNDKIYFAVKDVSIKGGHIGSVWPWNKGDGHDAPTHKIKTIDYSMGSTSGSPAIPGVPTNLKIE